MEDQTDNLNVSENDGVVVQEAVFVGSEPDVDVEDAEIRPTDIVFDCPHCGHNLCIDLRGAGLQTKCVECGESVLVPIPDGMKIDDLDLSQGRVADPTVSDPPDVPKERTARPRAARGTGGHADAPF